MPMRKIKFEFCVTSCERAQIHELAQRMGRTDSGAMRWLLHLAASEMGITEDSLTMMPTPAMTSPATPLTGNLDSKKKRADEEPRVR